MSIFSLIGLSKFSRHSWSLLACTETSGTMMKSVLFIVDVVVRVFEVEPGGPKKPKIVLTSGSNPCRAVWSAPHDHPA